MNPKLNKNNAIMKKIFLLLAAVFMTAGIMSAQDLNKAIEAANSGQEAFQLEEFDLAIDAFKNSLAIAEELGEEGAEHANTCKIAICNIHLASAKKIIKAGDSDGALAKLNETISVAQSYDVLDVVENAEELIPQVWMQKGNDALRSKDMANAIAAYTKVTELTPANGVAYIRLGSALAASGKVDEAVAAYEAAAANGREKDAMKQLSTLFLKRAQACTKTKDYQGAIDNALKANSYLENANAYKIAASSAQKLENNAQCIEFYEKYLAIKPDAKDAAGVAFTIAALYQQGGNNDKAIEWYETVVNDAQFGASAQEQLKVLKK